MKDQLAVYLAARYSRKDEIKEKAEELVDLGINVTSRWFNEPSTEDGLGNEKYGLQDIEDIDACDILILFSENPELPFKRGGRHFESGYAYGKNKNVIVVGPMENTFHFIKNIIKVDTWEELKANLKFLAKVKLI